MCDRQQLSVDPGARLGAPWIQTQEEEACSNVALKACTIQRGTRPSPSGLYVHVQYGQQTGKIKANLSFGSHSADKPASKGRALCWLGQIGLSPLLAGCVQGTLGSTLPSALLYTL